MSRDEHTELKLELFSLLHTWEKRVQECLNRVKQAEREEARHAHGSPGFWVAAQERAASAGMKYATVECRRELRAIILKHGPKPEEADDDS